MTFGSCATGIRESCQVGNEAALNGISRVTRGCLNRANCGGNVPGSRFEAQRTDFMIPKGIHIKENAQGAFFAVYNHRKTQDGKRSIMELTLVKSLYRETEQYLDQKVRVGGWVRSIRDSKTFGL